MAESVRKKSKGAAVCSTSYDEGWEHLYPDGPVNGNKNPFFLYSLSKDHVLCASGYWRCQAA